MTQDYPAADASQGDTPRRDIPRRGPGPADDTPAAPGRQGWPVSGGRLDEVAAAIRDAVHACGQDCASGCTGVDGGQVLFAREHGGVVTWVEARPETLAGVAERVYGPEIARLRKELTEARDLYEHRSPTQWAYEQACRALLDTKERLQRVRGDVSRALALIDEFDAEPVSSAEHAKWVEVRNALGGEI